MRNHVWLGKSRLLVFCRFHLHVPTTDAAISLVLELRCQPERGRLVLLALFSQVQLNLSSTRNPFRCCKRLSR